MFKVEPFEILSSFQNQVIEIIYNPNRNSILLFFENEIINLELNGETTTVALPDAFKEKKKFSNAFYHFTKNLIAIFFNESLYVINLNTGNEKFKVKYKLENKNFAFNKAGNIVAYSEADDRIQISWLNEKKKKSVKEIENINFLIFSQDSVNFPFLVALGEETYIISYDSGRILRKIFFSAKRALFTDKGERCFVLGKEANIIRVYQSYKLDSNPTLLNEIYPRFSNTHSILITPDDRILVGLSPEGLELWDITIPEQEVSLIWTKKYKNIKNGIFLPNSQLVTCDSQGNISKWNETFLLEEIRDNFKKFGDKIEEIKLNFRRVPQWVLDGNIETLERMELDNVEKNLLETKKIIHPSISSRFQPPEFPYWVEEVFKDEISSFLRIESKCLSSIEILETHIQKLQEKLAEKRERNKRLVERCVFYLKSFATGSKVSVEQIATYLSISSDETTLLLRSLEREKLLPPGRLVNNLFGRIDFLSGYETVVSNNLQIEKTDIYSCYFCANSILSADTHCTKCQKEILRCKSCDIPITRNQEKFDCKFCHETFHFQCYMDKVKIFKRCPNCKKEITKQEVENQFYTDAKEKARVSSSLGRMIQFKKSIKKEEKDPFDF